MEVDDRVWVTQLPEDGRGEAADADDEHPDDERGAEPVVDLAAVEEDLECCGAEADEGDADAVDAELAFGVGVGVVNESVGEEDREDADGDVDEENPAPVVVVGDPAAEDRADGWSGDDGDGVEREGGGAFGWRKGVDEDGLFDGRQPASDQSISCTPHFVFVPPVTSCAAWIISRCVRSITPR